MVCAQTTRPAPHGQGTTSNQTCPADPPDANGTIDNVNIVPTDDALYVSTNNRDTRHDSRTFAAFNTHSNTDWDKYGDHGHLGHQHYDIGDTQFAHAAEPSKQTTTAVSSTTMSSAHDKVASAATHSSSQCTLRSPLASTWPADIPPSSPQSSSGDNTNCLDGPTYISIANVHINWGGLWKLVATYAGVIAMLAATWVCQPHADDLRTRRGKWPFHVVITVMLNSDDATPRILSSTTPPPAGLHPFPVAKVGGLNGGGTKLGHTRPHNIECTRPYDIVHMACGNDPHPHLEIIREPPVRASTREHPALVFILDSMVLDIDSYRYGTRPCIRLVLLVVVCILDLLRAVFSYTAEVSWYRLGFFFLCKTLYNHS